MNISFNTIDKDNILSIFPLLSKINTKTPPDLLKNRIIEMGNCPNYECVAVFDDNELIGICGLWYSTRHYLGRSVEPDHVIISKTYRGKGLGKLFFEWIYEYTKQKGCEAMELNTYSTNTKSHKFYYNEGFNIYAFHFAKILREDQKFY
ncbi:GNAT family N-acetyltransferase [uncultured Tenacibaculum sp.]|uniref:GNAT family N-acetyltransferase n=1 Tax=uncultured Tenacibaculum sp. TaxID=174713 RepID=UPI0026018514|nr:GNAT family N-acetyltransferase [uncultured Tenacibaculum sp.]